MSLMQMDLYFESQLLQTHDNKAGSDKIFPLRQLYKVNVGFIPTPLFLS